MSAIVRYVLIGVGVLLSVQTVKTGAVEPPLPFTCDAFSPTATVDDLVARFGAEHVRKGLVPWGGAEGDENPGTILFGDSPDSKLNVFWKDSARQREPEWVSAYGASTRWRTAAGITLGTDLKSIEKLNGGPFRLIGLANDVQGSLVSWSGGRLNTQDVEACHVGVRLRWEGNSAGHPSLVEFEKEVRGDKVFSSGHPAMQALNPTVYELVIGYGRWPR